VGYRASDQQLAVEDFWGGQSVVTPATWASAAKKLLMNPRARWTIKINCSSCVRQDRFFMFGQPCVSQVAIKQIHVFGLRANVGTSGHSFDTIGGYVNEHADLPSIRSANAAFNEIEPGVEIQKIPDSLLDAPNTKSWNSVIIDRHD
jgi:hypothetical protein